MDIHITSVDDASRFEPVKPTYGIRIFSSWTSNREKAFYSLRPSSHWLHTAEYVFDDIWPKVLTWGFTPHAHVMFNDGMADAMVREFAEYLSRCEALLVHCSRGINRSPAVAIALNEAFGLGHDSGAMKVQYKESNWYVYQKILEAGRRYRI